MHLFYRAYHFVHFSYFSLYVTRIKETLSKLGSGIAGMSIFHVTNKAFFKIKMFENKRFYSQLIYTHTWMCVIIPCVYAHVTPFLVSRDVKDENNH